MFKLHKQISKYEKYYIISIICILLGVYFSILCSGKMYMFMDIGADTYCSYWPSIAYVKKMLSNIQLWDMKLGLGASTVTYISYFLLDPFNWVCFLFSDENIDKGIFIGLILKNLCLAYYAYQYVGKKKIYNWARVICSLMIVFCGWFVGWGQHYNFATVFVSYVAILFYFECWIQEARYIGLVLSTAFLAIISPYYCYMTLLFLVFYYLIDMGYYYQVNKKKVREVLEHMVKTMGVFLLGLGCSAIVFIPYMDDTLSSPRVSGRLWPSFQLGTLQEYGSLILRMFSNNILGINTNFIGIANFYECPFMYIGIVAVMVLPLYLFCSKLRKKYWLPMLAIVFTFLFINFSAPLFNAFSTKSFRWTYLFVPILAMACGKAIDVYEYEKCWKLIAAEMAFWNTFLILFYVWYTKKNIPNIEMQKSIIMVLIFMNLNGLALGFYKNKKNIYKLLLLIVICDLFTNAYMSVHERSLISEDSKATMAYFDDSENAIEYLKSIDSSFYRIQKTYAQIDLNDSMFQSYNGEKLYSSILPSEMWNMMELFDLRVKKSNYFYGFDDKQMLRNITVGKYRFTKQEEKYYGYDLVKKIGDIYVYKNENAIDFGVLYDKIVLEDSLAGLDDIQKQILLANYCVLENQEYDEEVQKMITNDNFGENLECNLIWEQLNSDEQTYNIYFDQLNNKPLVVEIYGENLEGTIEVYTQESEDGWNDTYTYSLENGVKKYYIDNLNVRTLVINQNVGKIDKIRIYQLNTSQLEKKINALKENNFYTEYFSNTYIKGHTDCNTEKVMMIPIAYNKNWKVRLNGQETKIYKADAGFMAVVIPQGHCNIEIEYVSKAFWAGSLITAIFAYIFIMLTIVTHRRKTKRERESE